MMAEHWKERRGRSGENGATGELSQRFRMVNASEVSSEATSLYQQSNADFDDKHVEVIIPKCPR